MFCDGIGRMRYVVLGCVWVCLFKTKSWGRVGVFGLFLEVLGGIDLDVLGCGLLC